jgi:hypothetical protein
MRRYVRFRARVVAVGVAACAVVAIAGAAVAGPAGAVKTFTGCLVVGDGVIIKVKEGDQPKSACTGGQTVARLSGGDITKIAVTGALTLPDGPGTGESGDVTIGLKPEFTLPSSCSNEQVAKWQSSTTSWICAADTDTTYSAGTGLDLSSSSAFSIESGYRLPGKACSTAGEFSRGFDSNGAIQCAAPATGGVHAYSAHVGLVLLAGETTVISKDLPAGTYLLFASLELKNEDGDSLSDARCSMPGYATGLFRLDEDDGTVAGHRESISMASAISHAGGAVVLSCTEERADVNVTQATLTAIKVDSLG